uniref:Nuclear transport factor 2 family protein n=1 Tax=Streptomyces sp. NBC_01393 TaxID=2903851 RepID=A0AAU3HZY4_9ACTN
MTTSATDTPFGYPEGSREAAGVARVIRHFDLIDEGDMAAMVGLFTPDAVYHRPGHETFLGQSGIRHFYTQLRVICSGRHTIDTAVASGGQVAVHGGFRGVQYDGTPVDLRFSDFFRMADDNRFTRRDTFFFATL